MIKSSQIQRRILTATLTIMLLQACMQVRVDAPPALPTPQDIETVAIAEQPAATATSTPTTVPATATEISPTATTQPRVVISAVKGNIFIRRGPDMAFNPIGVLYKDTSAPVIARDVLSNWVQIVIPNSDQKGWISIQTQYSKVDGDLKTLPEFTTTEWPTPAYLRNCTHHQMYILPAEVILLSSFDQPDNMVWLYPGTYTVYDLEVSGEPEVATVEVREGVTVEILDDGAGEHRKCP
jgi:hypothetical protein